MDERDIERTAAQLGRHAGEGLDVDRVAQRVVARLKESTQKPPWWMRNIWLKAAVIAGFLVASSVVAVRLATHNGSRDQPFVASSELADLNVSELQDVLDSLEQEAPAYELVAVGLDDLDEDELGELLALMEG